MASAGLESPVVARRFSGMAMVCAFAMLTLCVFTFTKHRMGQNVRSRYVTVERFVDHGTMSHPDASSIDTVQVDGKYYSSKPPNYSLILSAEAYIVKLISGWALSDHEQFYLTFLIIVNQIIPYAFVLWATATYIKRYSDNPWTRTYAMVASTFGVLPFGYAVTLNNHTPTAFFLILALIVLIRMRHEGHDDWRHAVVLGMLVSFAASFELSAAVFAIAFILMAGSPRLVACAIGGALIPAIPTMVTTYAISGKPFPFYLQKNLYHFPGSYWDAPRNSDALDQPKWLYAFNALIGWKGFFSLSPVMALGVAGIIQSVRARAQLWREMLATGVCGLVVIVYIIATTNNYGGSCMGMRWYSNFAPLFVLAALPALDRLSVRRNGRILAYVLLAISSEIVIESLIMSAFKNGGWVLGLIKVWEWYT